jgi:hypothetical protein
MRKVLRLLFVSFAALLFFSCGKGKFVEGFDPVSNYNSNTLTTDLSEAVLTGIEIPTRKQTNNGYFVFKFKVRNTSSDIKKFYYKIYYQNSTYKFNDTSKYSHENFYGSWANGLFTFKPTRILDPGEEANITDSFKIVGNPRNEVKYFGADPDRYLALDDSIRSKMEFIRKVPAWMKSIQEKARQEETTVEEQIYLNALWGINDEKQRSRSTNNRWRRNPRMGTYEFMLVVTSPEDIGKIPMEVRDIQMTNSRGNFTNPFAYFLWGGGKLLKHTFVQVSEKKLKVNCKLDPASGIYVDKLSINKSNFTFDALNPTCNNSTELYKSAQFKQYFHNIDKDYTVYNVPEIRDITGENFTRNDYETLKSKYADKKTRAKMYVSTSDCPCKTVESKEGKLKMIVPATEPGKWRKEHVGISSRLGYTYGKFRAKIKFPAMLSKDNVWNGITNAFWLLFQEDAAWNNRRDCNAKVAYIPREEPDNETALNHSKKTLAYSEIDFEIVKESQYWPKTSYQNGASVYKTDDPYNDHKVMVTCTNWDMACQEPKQFNWGAKDFKIEGNTYTLHRWNPYYRALSTKIPVDHDEIFNASYYYFEIDWQPEKIIWRIGPEKEKMRVICVMDASMSSIPNNQMMLMFTQEWHNEEWWPTAPFKQNFIPFPKKDIIGEILEIEIE